MGVKPKEAYGLGGGRHSVAARLQAHMSSPPRQFKYPRYGGCHLWGGWDVQLFTLAVFPEQPTQMLVFTKNVTVQGRENHPC